MQSQPMHRSWEIDALASSELLKSEQPLRSKDQKQAPWLACDLSVKQIRRGPLSSYRFSFLLSKTGGGERDRTDDLLLAKQALSQLDRKSTRLNSSHLVISYAVFCLKKKN